MLGGLVVESVNTSASRTSGMVESGRRRSADGTREAGDSDRRNGRPCPLCEEPMYHRHCKYVCPSHGVVYDCSDTFY